MTHMNKPTIGLEPFSVGMVFLVLLEVDVALLASFGERCIIPRILFTDIVIGQSNRQSRAIFRSLFNRYCRLCR